MVIHTSSPSIQQREKKLHLHHSQRERTRTTQKQTLNTTKRPPPPNKVSQTVYERAAEYSSKEKARERDASNAFSPHGSVLIEEKNSTFFSQKKVTKKDAERHRVSSLFSTLRKVYHHVLNTYTRTYKRTHKHEHRTTVFVFVEELRFHRRHGKRDALAQEE